MFYAHSLAWTPPSIDNRVWQYFWKCDAKGFTFGEIIILFRFRFYSFFSLHHMRCHVDSIYCAILQTDRCYSGLKSLSPFKQTLVYCNLPILMQINTWLVCKINSYFIVCLLNIFFYFCLVETSITNFSACVCIRVCFFPRFGWTISNCYWKEIWRIQMRKFAYRFNNSFDCTLLSVRCIHHLHSVAICMILDLMSVSWLNGRVN